MVMAYDKRKHSLKASLDIHVEAAATLNVTLTHPLDNGAKLKPAALRLLVCCYAFARHY